MTESLPDTSDWPMSAYTARQMEHLVVIADFAAQCSPDDYEIWMYLIRDRYTQTEIARMLNLSKPEVLNAIRRVERIRAKYEKKVEATNKSMDYPCDA